jgi:hypothetical protein
MSDLEALGRALWLPRIIEERMLRLRQRRLKKCFSGIISELALYR